MPVRHKLPRHKLPQTAQLRRQLADEMRQPHQAGEPLVLIEQPQPDTTHLWVVWSSFDGFELVVRSSIIQAAYAAVRGAQAALNVTVSIGLTPEEAERAGIGCAASAAVRENAGGRAP